MSILQAQHYLVTHGWREVSPRVYTNRDGGLKIRIVPITTYIYKFATEV